MDRFWQFWALIATLTMAESSPEAWLESSKPHDTKIMNSNATWKATIHTYSLKKFQKLQQLHAVTVTCPRVQKAILATIVL